MTERKTKSLYGASICESLTHEMPYLKSEELPSYRPFYVDFSMLDELHNNSNQLVIGRRGTGKTHLLGTFNELIRDEFPTELSVMISIMEACPITPPGHDTESKEFSRKRLAKAKFKGFLRVFFGKLLAICDRRIKTMLAAGIERSKCDDANTLLTRLLEEIELGSAHKTKATFREHATEKIVAEHNLSGKAGISVGGAASKISLEGGVGRGQKENSVTERNTDIEGILSVDLYEIRKLVHELLDALGIETLYILIDEWMELEKETPSNIQPIFAQYLKTTFFNSRQIAIKIASVWHQTTLYDRDDMERSHGIQLKHDIIPSIDLDTAFITANEEVWQFCKSLLFKRLAFICEDIRCLELSDGEIDNIFVTELFDNEDNFKAFITATHGIPRDIMQLFQKCSLKIKRNFEKRCISHKLVFTMSKETYNKIKRKNIDPTSTAQTLLSAVNRHMEAVGSRIFLVENGQSGKSKALRKLVDEELVHQIPSSVTPRAIRDTHKVYIVDFGNYVDWITTKSTDLSSLLAESVLAKFPDDFGDRYKDFVIDVSATEVDILNCLACRKKVEKTHPVFVKAGICPQCAVPVTV